MFPDRYFPIVYFPARYFAGEEGEGDTDTFSSAFITRARTFARPARGGYATTPTRPSATARGAIAVTPPRPPARR